MFITSGTKIHKIIDLWCYINIIIKILDIIYSPVFYLKNIVSETASCLRLQEGPT
jgi:hypothetical protein